MFGFGLLIKLVKQVKAEKYSAKTCLHRHGSGPRTPTYDYEEAANSLVSTTQSMCISNYFCYNYYENDIILIIEKTTSF